MNIKNATVHIKNTVIAYLEKDENGNFIIPVEKQRPVFLYGPPGIGKTAIMEQIASEMGIGLVSYSMTHHTRQSAIGLPFITKKKFGDKEYDVSEYTMSEILASVYDYIEKTGKKEGILFLDEINCVSETLSPSMLRFLQYKSFGSHTVPEGWVIITAGNPPEYNKSVREYDIATLDRIKKIDVEPDYGIWREYAVNNNVHPAIITYLDIKSNSFYNIENTPAGKRFVTARGWEDLSRIMCLYDRKGIETETELIEQYLQSPEVTRDFADFYAVYKKLNTVFDLKLILEQKTTESIIKDAKELNISQKLGLINVLTDLINQETKKCTETSNRIKCNLKSIKESTLSDEEKAEKLNIEKASFDNLKTLVGITQNKICNGVDFMFGAFGNAPETEIFVSNITLNKNSASFLMSFGCDKFAKLSDNSYYKDNINNELEDIIQ
ncbi:MAG: AAA family ATPase [Clostridia bacterium]|nr:AAA family ATPase [Clostridia bacterium]